MTGVGIRGSGEERPGYHPGHWSSWSPYLCAMGGGRVRCPTGKETSQVTFYYSTALCLISSQLALSLSPMYVWMGGGVRILEILRAGQAGPTTERGGGGLKKLRFKARVIRHIRYEGGKNPCAFLNPTLVCFNS